MTITETPAKADRDWWVLVGMTIAAASAAVASFSGLRGLAEAAGWPPHMAWLLPVTIDAYAMTSARVWLAASTRSGGARRFARANALGAIAASTAGNAAYHAIAAGLLTATWPIIVLVGAVPATVLGLTAHLHALRGRSASSGHREDGTGSRTEPRSTARPGNRSERRARYRTEDELLTAARAADARYREANAGRPITRDALRVALRISGPRATELRRTLAAEATPQVPEREENTTHP